MGGPNTDALPLTAARVGLFLLLDERPLPSRLLWLAAIVQGLPDAHEAALSA